MIVYIYIIIKFQHASSFNIINNFVNVLGFGYKSVIKSSFSYEHEFYIIRW